MQSLPELTWVLTGSPKKAGYFGSKRTLSGRELSPKVPSSPESTFGHTYGTLLSHYRPSSGKLLDLFGAFRVLFSHFLVMCLLGFKVPKPHRVWGGQLPSAQEVTRFLSTRLVW